MNLPDIKMLTQTFMKPPLLADDNLGGGPSLCLFYKKFVPNDLLAVLGHGFYCEFGFIKKDVFSFKES